MYPKLQLDLSYKVTEYKRATKSIKSREKTWHTYLNMHTIKSQSDSYATDNLKCFQTSIPKTKYLKTTKHWPNMMVHAFNPSIWGLREADLLIFKANLVNIKVLDQSILHNDTHKEKH